MTSWPWIDLSRSELYPSDLCRELCPSELCPSELYPSDLCPSDLCPSELSPSELWTRKLWPFELHLPGYQFCGPGTLLEERLSRGEVGINLLDAACREHDIRYSQTNDPIKILAADKILAEKAGRRMLAKDANLGERVAATVVKGSMEIKIAKLKKKYIFAGLALGALGYYWYNHKRRQSRKHRACNF